MMRIVALQLEVAVLGRVALASGELQRDCRYDNPMRAR